MFENELMKNGLANTTIRTYKSRLKTFLKFHGGSFTRTYVPGRSRWPVPDSVSFEQLPVEITELLIAFKQKGMAKSTISGYKSTLIKAKAFFDKIEVDFASVKFNQLELFAIELKGEGLSQPTVNSHVWRLDCILKVPDSKRIRRSREKKVIKQKPIKISVEPPKEISDYLIRCKEKNYARGTIANYRSRLCAAKQFFDTIGYEIVMVTNMQVDEFVIYLLNEGFANDTVLGIVKLLHRFLRFHGNNRIHKVVYKITRVLKAKPFKSSSPSLEELPVLLKQVDSCGRPKDIAIFYTLFEIGIPVSELCALMMADLRLGFNDQFDFKEWNGKGSGAMTLRVRGTFIDRTLLIPERAETAILNYLAWQTNYNQGSRYLFPNQKGDAMIPMVVYDKMKVFFEQIKTGKKGSRAIRHGHIRLLFENDTDFLIIWALSGYKQLGSVERHAPSKVVPVGSIYNLTHPRA